jgi:hypothetical protein
MITLHSPNAHAYARDRSAWPARAGGALLLMLAGCAQHSIKPLDLGPLHLSCPAECKATCIPEQWPQWTGDPDSPQTWDTWPEQVALELRQMVETCESKRAACVRCIGNAESVGVVCGITRECG